MGSLYIVATPIGNLEDITVRALRTLFSVDCIACEDTRSTNQLLTLLVQRYSHLFDELKKPKPELISFYDEIEESKSFEIIEILKQNKNVALVSDAGTPLLADPGYKLIRSCIKENIRIIPLPGACALLPAIVVSGHPMNTFTFLGFLPDKSSKRIDLFTALKSASQTQKKTQSFIGYESPHRISKSLTDLKEVFGDIEIVLAKELTKLHEEILRGKISEVQLKLPAIKGELVLLFSIQSVS